jgi:hypothetical protein
MALVIIENLGKKRSSTVSGNIRKRQAIGKCGNIKG